MQDNTQTTIPCPRCFNARRDYSNLAVVEACPNQDCGDPGFRTMTVPAGFEEKAERHHAKSN